MACSRSVSSEKKFWRLDKVERSWSSARGLLPQSDRFRPRSRFPYLSRRAAPQNWPRVWITPRFQYIRQLFPRFAVRKTGSGARKRLRLGNDLGPDRQNRGGKKREVGGARHADPDFQPASPQRLDYFAEENHLLSRMRFSWQFHRGRTPSPVDSKKRGKVAPPFAARHSAPSARIRRFRRRSRNVAQTRQSLRGESDPH